MNDIDHWTNDIHTGDAAETLAELPADSVHMVMTSPPYFGLRDYGVDGQIGLEDELDEYIAELVDVFREVRRVLRPDGSAWLNLGDSYDGGKNKMLVPHRVAIALQDDGWIVRNDATWAKPNPMPQSVKDRLNDTTEQVFHLVPEPDYWYDLDAIREPHVTAEHHERYHGNGQTRPKQDAVREEQPVQHELGQENTGCHPAGKNPGDVFEVTTKPFPEAHFAVYPPELVETPLKATCPPKVCADCGSPYERQVDHEKIPLDELPESNPNYRPNTYARYSGVGEDRNDASEKRTLPARETTGWEPTCDCGTDATESGITLDPFAGAGTTCLVAKQHGRRFIGVDLNEEYVAMAQKRLGLTVDHPEHVRQDDAQEGLEAFDP